jgi:hypothetical protein
MNEELIAPCGMNCAVCSGYLALVNEVRNKGVRMAYCRGCRPRNKICAFLKKRCKLLLESKVEYCYECPDFPCEKLKHIDANYRKKFRMSMIENLEFIREHGIQRLLARETDTWKCPDCGETICCHNGICFNCGLERLKIKEKLYRWEDD